MIKFEGEATTLIFRSKWERFENNREEIVIIDRSINQLASINQINLLKAGSIISRMIGGFDRRSRRKTGEKEEGTTIFLLTSFRRQLGSRGECRWFPRNIEFSFSIDIEGKRAFCKIRRFSEFWNDGNDSIVVNLEKLRSFSHTSRRRSCSSLYRIVEDGTLQHFIS